MSLIKSLNGKTPSIGKDCFLAENACIIGDTTIGDHCSIWFNAVIRGDVNSISIGNNVNVQDGAVIHCTYQKTKTVIANNVSIGHNAIVHGCHIESNVLVGMGAIIMDNCIIEEGSVIAAGSVVLENTHVKAGSLYAGTPAKFIKMVGENLRKGEIERIANNYGMYSSWYK